MSEHKTKSQKRERRNARVRRSLRRDQRLKLAVALMAKCAELLDWQIMMRGKRVKRIRYIVIGEKRELEEIDRILMAKKPIYTIGTATSSGKTFQTNLRASCA